MEKTDVTVIVPAYQCAKILPTLLAHLELQSHPAARIETIIVDMGSTDGTPEVAARYAAGAPIRTQCLAYEPLQGGRALAAAVKAARGRWLLFLHQDLLAGTHWIRSHIRIQEQHGGSIVVRGRVDRHPQAGRPLNLEAYRFYDKREPQADARLPYVDWRMWNLSVPKDLVQKAGGIAEEFPYADYVDVHLAWRMRAQGVDAIYHPDATAYAWFVPDVWEERQRAYVRGFSRSILLRHIQDDDVRWRFGVEYSSARALVHTFSDPFWSLLAGSLPVPHSLRAYATGKLLRHDMVRGYRAALAGRAPSHG